MLLLPVSCFDSPTAGDDLTLGVKVSCSSVCISLRWLRSLFVRGQEFGPLVFKGLGCLDGSRESLAVYESASHCSSHPDAVVLVLFLLRWCSWYSCVGLETSFQDVAVDTTRICAGSWRQKRALARLRCGSKRRVALHTIRPWWLRKASVSIWILSFGRLELHRQRKL